MNAPHRWKALIECIHARRPGRGARGRLSPVPSRGRLDAAIPDDARPAAVLMLIVEDDGLWMPMMRRRPMEHDRHSGQISLPGGSLEAGETAVEAALRESHEELGIEPSTVEVLGQLEPLWIPVSGFVVHPVIGVARGRQDLVCDPVEVEHGFWVDLDALGRSPVVERPGESRERKFTMRGWELPEGYLWGATAMMLAELLAMMDESGS